MKLQRYPCSAEVPEERTGNFVSVLCTRAENQTDRLAYVFLRDGESDEVRLTYGELDRMARSIAVLIRESASPGDRVLLMYPSGPEFISAYLGCLYAGVIAVPMFRPRPNRKLTRMESVIEDSGAEVALTTTEILSELATRWSDHEQLTGIEYVPTDDVPLHLADQWRPVELASNEPAYLQYTSGSTSAPKGVIITHGNLTYNCAYMREAYGLTEDTRSVTWAPHFHDMGLIEGLLNPLFTGYSAVVLSPEQFIQRPVRWLEALSRYRGTHAGAPNFAFDLCVRRIKPEERDALDLSCWRIAYSGAEPVREETLNRFSEYFRPCGFRRAAFYPCYGLAEATLMVTGGSASDAPIVMEVDSSGLEQGQIHPAGDGSTTGRPLVGCGRSHCQTQIMIVDPQTQEECPTDRVGEIWVGGPTVAGGYWSRLEESDRTFHAYTADGQHGPFLRTGDLGFMSDGELFITGRLKDLIIIRGANFYPQDIEWTAESAHPALRPGFSAAFSHDAGGEERLIIALELERQYRRADEEELEAIADAVRQAIYGEFEVEAWAVVLLRIGSIRKTSSGKIQRQGCRSDYLAGKLNVVSESRLNQRCAKTTTNRPRLLNREELATLGPRDRRRVLEDYLRGELGLVLGIPVGGIPSGQTLGSLGLDSMRGTELVARLREGLGLEFANTVVWNYPTIADIASHVAHRMGIDLESNIPATDNGREAVPLAPDDAAVAELLGEANRLAVEDLRELLATRTTRGGESS